MKAYRKSRSTSPFTVNPGSRWTAAVNFASLLLYPWERTSSVHWIRWMSTRLSVRMLQEKKKKKKELAPTRIWTLDHPACILVAILTKLPHLQVCTDICCYVSITCEENVNMTTEPTHLSSYTTTDCCTVASIHSFIQTIK
jgi:hypothetical protein